MELLKDRRWKAAFWIALSALAVGLMALLSVWLTPQIVALARHHGEARRLLLSHGAAGVFAYMGLQALQVVLAFIPGEPLQLAGGYLYGALPATGLILAGVLAGEVVSFFVGRLLGSPLVALFMSRKRQERLSRLFGGARGKLLVFLLFLIPGLPKDALSYLAGVTPMTPLTFLGLSMLARLPATLGGAFIGSSLQVGHYKTAGLVLLAAVLLFAAGLWFREPILRWMESHSRRKASSRD